MKILRMIPKKPVNKTGYPEEERTTCDGFCPNCMDFVCNITPISKRITYCNHCGQAIKWY